MSTIIGLDRSKFTTIQGDAYVAFKSTDNLTELSFKPYLKGDLELVDGVLDLTKNNISYLEIEATHKTNGSASIISSLTGNVTIENGFAYANFGQIIGSGEFSLKVIAVTTDGRSIVLVGPQMLSAPVLTLFADPDAIEDVLRSDKSPNIILSRVSQAGEATSPSTYDTAVYRIMDGATEKLSLSLGNGISVVGDKFRIAISSTDLDFTGDFVHDFTVGITDGDSFIVFNRQVRVL